MNNQPPRNYSRIAAAIIIAAVVVAGGVVAATYVGTSSTVTLVTTTTVFRTVTGATATIGQSTTQSVICSITGQPAGFLLRVLSDSNQAPIAGAQVTATSRPQYCDPNTPATSQTTLTFTTNNTEWYSLNSQYTASYTLVVKYSGQSYNFTANLRPVSETCATLYIPSGKTNVTITALQTFCP
jgi:hypothetical protein